LIKKKIKKFIYRKKYFLLPLFRNKWRVSKYGHGRLVGYFIESYYNVTESNNHLSVHATYFSTEGAFCEDMNLESIISTHNFEIFKTCYCGRATFEYIKKLVNKNRCNWGVFWWCIPCVCVVLILVYMYFILFYIQGLLCISTYL